MIEITHIHPMLVHFPIVLFLGATVMFCWISVKRGDVAARECLPLTAAWALVVGLLMGYLAAFFGDIALDAAAAKGFAVPPMELHEEMATITLVVFSLLAAVLLGAHWKKIPLNRNKAWGFTAVALAGVVLLLVTAYFGGDLVHRLGVNVRAVVPGK